MLVPWRVAWRHPSVGLPGTRCGRSTPTIVARAARMDTRATTACLSLPAPGPAPGSRHGGRGKGSRRVRGARGLLFSQRTGLYPSVSGLASPAQAQSTTGSTVPREPAALGGQVTDCRASVTTPAGDTGGSWVRCTVVVTGMGERAQTTGPDSSQREPASGPPAPRALTAPPGGQRTPHPPHSAPRGVWGVPGQLRSVLAHSRPLRLSPLCPTLWWLSALCDRNHRQWRSQKEPLLPCQGPEVDSPGPLWWPRKAWLLPDSRCLAGLARPPGLAGATAPPVVTFRVGGEEQGERGPPRKSTASHDVTVRSPAKGADITPSVPDMQEI